MLHRVEDPEVEHTDPTQAATNRAKTLHAGYYAFAKGQFEPLLAGERKHREGAPNKAANGNPKHKNLGRGSRSAQWTKPDAESRRDYHAHTRQ